MIITLWLKNSGLHIDIKVNREQKIMDTLLILQNGGVFTDKIDLHAVTIYSERQERHIDMEHTYQESAIYNGDILSIV